MNPAAKLSTEALSLGIAIAMIVTLSSHAQLITLEDRSAKSAETAQAQPADQDAVAPSDEQQAQETPAEDAQPVVVAQPVVTAQPVLIAQRPVQVASRALRANPAMTTQPVAIAPGMLPAASTPVATRSVETPQVAFAARTVRQEAPAEDPSMGLSVTGAGTGIGGSNPGNANTGGVQVQNVTVTATQDQQSENSSDLLKRARLMKEEETNREALDKIEENRFESEAQRRERVKNIFKEEGIQNGNGMGLQSVPAQELPAAPIVVPVAPMNPDQAMVAPVAPVTVVQTSVESNDSSRGGFRLVPMAGYRWSENNASEYESRNMGVGGVGLEGVVSKNISIEGSFLYGRDDFYHQGYNNGYYNGANYSNGNYNNYNNGYYNNGYSPYNSYNPYDPLSAPRSRDSFEVNGALKLGARMGSVRPYVLGGIGGMLQKYNIDDSITTEMLTQNGMSRTTTHVVGNFGGGADLVAGGNLTVGARFDYQSFLNREYTETNRIFGDMTNRYRVIGSVQMIF